MSWIVGQRVRNEAEPALGVGQVSQLVNSRTIEVDFPASGERRLYNILSAPLHREILSVGQVARALDGRTLRIARVEAEAGLCRYSDDAGQSLLETELEFLTSSAGPLERLVAGDVSHFSDYDLRRQGWRLRQQLWSSPGRGLAGARVMLLPHQLAIAYRVTRRELPRVLLADEVGLGKTIEACLIFSALRAVGRADRVLVLTPTSLVHQWLTELYRRFNELFRVLEPGTDPEEHLDVIEESTRIIAPLEAMLEPEVLEAVAALEWDLLIVDEAHHLRWTPRQTSPEYRIVQMLAARSRGLLLLTATPLKEGLETEFALLHLVDPERFPDFKEFRAEHDQRRSVAELAQRFVSGDEGAAAELVATFPEDDGLAQVLATGDRRQALRELVDRHGTGRVLVRNRRERLGGFPGRRVHSVRLAGDEERSQWLFAFLRQDRTRKVLVMAADVESVLELERQVREQTGLKVALFHERLSLLERDRQAAYFAESDGAQVLLSSEIGGEGRNFQFCHHLVLFDLPAHPDAVEQRIGRLDRIGQTHTIEVHVLWIEDHPSCALWRWHQALGSFEGPVGGADHLMARVAERLQAAVDSYPSGDLEALIESSREILARYRQAVSESVDVLIDLNSFDPELGQELVDGIEGFDLEDLQSTTSQLLSFFGISEEETAVPDILKLKPGDLMRVEPPFPGLRDDGYLATYRRELALRREELEFLGPDHPLIEGALGLLLDQGEGRATLGLWTGPRSAGGPPCSGVWVQFLFLLQAVGPISLELHRYLPLTTLEVTLDLQGRLQSATIGGLRTLGREAAQVGQILARLQSDLGQLAETADEAAAEQAKAPIQAALAAARAALGREHRRHLELQKLGHLSGREVELHQGRVLATLQALESARPSLDAVRLLLLVSG